MNHQTMNTICNHHLCIKHSDINLILKSLELLNSEKIVVDNTFNWTHIYRDEFEVLIIDTKLEWTYLIFNIWDFNLIKSIAEQLSDNLKTIVNYFFIDPWIFTTRWIHSKNGKINRSFWQDHETVFEDSGYLSLENELKNNPLNPNITEIDEIDIIWDETAKLYWNLSSMLSPALSTLNSKHSYNGIRAKLNKTAYNKTS